MKILYIIFVLGLSTIAAAQHKFELKDASKHFDVRVEVAECDDMFCRGEATFSFYKKGSTNAYQVISLPDTLVQLGDSGKPLTNVTMLYDAQSAVNVGDFNFDGMEDVALCDGDNGSYGGPSYRIYLSSRVQRRFVFSGAFTELGNHLGMFEVDKKKKRLRTFDKGGCCLHTTEEYEVIANRPVKVFEETEDATIADETRVRITTRTRLGGKWKTRVRYEKRVR